MIIDANCLTAYKGIEKLFEDYHAICFFIKLECEEEEILKRIDKREEKFGIDKSNYSRATRKDYYIYLDALDKNPFPEEKIFFTINTQGNLEQQTNLLVDKIKEAIVKMQY